MAERIGVKPDTVARWERGELPVSEPVSRLQKRSRSPYFEFSYSVKLLRLAEREGFEPSVRLDANSNILSRIEIKKSAGRLITRHLHKHWLCRAEPSEGNSILHVVVLSG